jgi:hypothetical protein
MTEQSLVDTAALIVHALGVAGAAVTSCAIAVDLIGAVAPEGITTLDLNDVGPRRRRRAPSHRGVAGPSRRTRRGTASRSTPARRLGRLRRPRL